MMREGIQGRAVAFREPIVVEVRGDERRGKHSEDDARAARHSREPTRGIEDHDGDQAPIRPSDEAIAASALPAIHSAEYRDSNDRTKQ